MSDKKSLGRKVQDAINRIEALSNATDEEATDGGFSDWQGGTILRLCNAGVDAMQFTRIQEEVVAAKFSLMDDLWLSSSFYRELRSAMANLKRIPEKKLKKQWSALLIITLDSTVNILQPAVCFHTFTTVRLFETKQKPRIISLVGESLQTKDSVFSMDFSEQEISVTGHSFDFAFGDYWIALEEPKSKFKNLIGFTCKDKRNKVLATIVNQVNNSERQQTLHWLENTKESIRMNNLDCITGFEENHKNCLLWSDRFLSEADSFTKDKNVSQKKRNKCSKQVEELKSAWKKVYEVVPQWEATSVLKKYMKDSNEEK